VTWYWLSFAGDKRWLGAAIVEAPDFITAVHRSHVLGCNPGGEVMGQPFPDGVAPPPEYANRLLTRAECEAFDRAMGGDGALEKVRP